MNNETNSSETFENNAAPQYKHFVPPPPLRKAPPPAGTPAAAVPAEGKKPESVPAGGKKLMPARDVSLEDKLRAKIVNLQTMLEEERENLEILNKKVIDLEASNAVLSKKRQDETPEEVEELRSRAEAAEKSLADKDEVLGVKIAETEKYKAALAQSIADFDNYRRRTSEETPKNILYGKISLAKDLLPVVDNFKLALESIKKTNPEATGIVDGVSMIEKQLLAALAKHEIVEMNPVGELFNPQEHEALSMMVSADVEEDHVMFVQRTGFKLGNQLIRPASVVVSKKAD